MDPNEFYVKCENFASIFFFAKCRVYETRSHVEEMASKLMRCIRHLISRRGGR